MKGLHEALGNDLRRRIRGQVETDDVTRVLYSTAACMFQIEPMAVVAPRDANDVAEIVRYCRRHQIPITCRGAGSSVAGQAIGEGIVLDFRRHMNRILEVDPERRRARVQPGVVLEDLNRRLHRWGLHFAPDPSSRRFCTLGGMINTNAGGIHSVKYGTTRDHLSRLRVVLDTGDPATLRRMRSPADEGRLGSIVRDLTGLLEAAAGLILQHKPLAPKSSSGYHVWDVLSGGTLDLPRLYSGSEGTLAVLTEARLKLTPLPRRRTLIVLGYRGSEEACDRIGEILGLKPSALELVDETTMGILLGFTPLARKVFGGPGAVLLVEFDDRRDVAEKKSRALRDLCRSDGFRVCSPEEAREVWAVRRQISPALERRPGPGRSTRLNEDVCVDPGRVGEYLTGLKDLLRRYGFAAAIFGHAGSGNIHVNLFVDTRNGNELERLQTFGTEVYRLVRDLRGSMSGEHGDGLLRVPYMRDFFGPLYEVFQSIKRIFDPENLFNPGKKLGPKGYRFVQDLRPSRRPGTARFVDARLAPIQQAAEGCIGCMKCNIYCPLYAERPEEAATPRAKTNLLLAASRSRLDLARLVADERFLLDLDRCSTCRLCLSDCPAGVDLPRIADYVLGLPEKINVRA